MFSKKNKAHSALQTVFNVLTLNQNINIDVVNSSDAKPNNLLKMNISIEVLGVGVAAQLLSSQGVTHRPTYRQRNI